MPGKNGRNVTDILQECLEQIERGEATVAQCIANHSDHPELVDLLAAASSVRDVPSPALDSLVRVDLRQQMLARFTEKKAARLQQGQALTVHQDGHLDNHSQPQSSGHASWRAFFPYHLYSRLALLSFEMMVILMMMVGGQRLVLASQDALPGDALYGLKRNVEQAEVTLTSAADKPALLQQLAETRLRELALLSGRHQKLPDSLVLDTAQSVQLALMAQTNPAARSLFASQAAFLLQSAQGVGSLDSTRGGALVTLINTLKNVPFMQTPAQTPTPAH